MHKKRRQHLDDRNAANVELYFFHEKTVLHQTVAALRHHIDEKDPRDIGRGEPENIGRVADRQILESFLEHVPEDQDRDEGHDESPYDTQEGVRIA